MSHDEWAEIRLCRLTGEYVYKEPAQRMTPRPPNWPFPPTLPPSPHTGKPKPREPITEPAPF